ncbi:helix-turn-helix transcriptional regulator [Actinoplanes sp. NPDC051861]|uniref:helix-turn-helix transcriptional regulator n=1 Tax=Actinoplanes sp. NPDC051861 TaxID=3155170 RepID=UPI00343799EC
MSARDLLSTVRTDPSAPLRAAICAPGGYGKSTLLAGLERIYREAGVTAGAPWLDPESDVLLVDDAHRLDDERLRTLRDRAERPGGRIVVAYRPWPRPAALAPLTEVLRRTRPPVVLAPLSAAEIRDRVGEHLAAPVAALSAGVPRYVDRLAAAFAGLSGAEATARPPAAALAPFAPEFDELDADLRTLLLAVEAGAGLSYDLIAELLERDQRTVAELVAAGQAGGMLGTDGAMVPLARHALAALGPMAQRIDVRQRLAVLQMARGGPVLPLVLHLLPDGGSAPRTSPELALAFEAAGEETLDSDPALAARFFAAAAEAGRPSGARRALATALSGDLDLAAQLADRAVASGSPAQRAESAWVSAVAMAHRGRLDSATELLRWAGTGPAAGFRSVGLTGTGHLDEDAEPAGTDGPPTLVRATADLMARGVRESVTGTPAAALSTLVQASLLLEPAGAAALLPDSPAALAAIVALHTADLDTAETTLSRAVRAGMGGPPLAPRHLLLQAWGRMLRGHLGAAARLLTEAPGVAGLPGRDLLFATALRVALARRDSDPVGLRTVWPDACQVLISQPVDLFTLLPLGELTVAAARLGEQRRVAEHLGEADRLLRRLGDPPLWSAPLHWSRLHAAILAEQPEEAERHAAALSELAGDRPVPATPSGPLTAAPSGPLAAAPAGVHPLVAALAAAARSWLAVITDRIDPEQVEAAAHQLAATGLTWDGARLAGQAAIRTKDRKAMTALLDCARLLQGRAPEHHDAADPAAEPAAPLLSEREQQVAALVLAGLTYKQIAERLYLSAKTIEHHVARIRQRLGVTDRRELLARLRELLADQTSDRKDGATHEARLA